MLTVLASGSGRIDQDGSSILEALYERYAATGQPVQAATHDDEQEEPRGDEEPLEDGEEKTPRRSRARSRAKKN